LFLELANKFRKKHLLHPHRSLRQKFQGAFARDDSRIYGSTELARWSYAATKAMDEFLALAYYRTKQLSIVCPFLIGGPKANGAIRMVIRDL